MITLYCESLIENGFSSGFLKIVHNSVGVLMYVSRTFKYVLLVLFLVFCTLTKGAHKNTHAALSKFDVC